MVILPKEWWNPVWNPSYLCSGNFTDVVISIKASNTVVMVKTVRLLVDVMEKEGMTFPLHLGVTEAGDGEDGRINLLSASAHC